MDWKKFVEKKNAKLFVLPAGWDSRDKIAEQLECSPDRVDDHLRPALKSGEVERQQFPVWDAALKRKVLVTAYREAGKAQASSEFDLARAQSLKKEGKSYAEIGAALGLSGDQVRGRMRRVG